VTCCDSLNLDELARKLVDNIIKGLVRKGDNVGVMEILAPEQFVFSRLA
jgi:predicted RNA-binding protein YlqC (UPF0109 family)